MLAQLENSESRATIICFAGTKVVITRENEWGRRLRCPHQSIHRRVSETLRCMALG